MIKNRVHFLAWQSHSQPLSYLKGREASKATPIIKGSLREFQVGYLQVASHSIIKDVDVRGKGWVSSHLWLARSGWLAG
jgi:hypothetical protein